MNVVRLCAIPALFAVVLSACGGNGNDGAEATRPQDARSFSVVEASLPFEALSGAPETDRWWGTHGGAGYRIEVPKAWNGMLVMYAHGYAGTGPELAVTTPSIRRHLISHGYAWAASSYSRNYYDVRAGVEDTNALATAFRSIAEQRGRPLNPPSRTYIVGHSMGGHIAAAAVDEEALETASHKMEYAGAVPMCGVLGDTELFNYFAATQTAAQVEAGLPATSWPVTNWAEIAPTVLTRLFSSFPSAANPIAPAVPTQQGLRQKQIVENLSGGDRPLFDFAYAGPLQATVWGTFGRDGKLQGILNEDVVSTNDIVYQLDTDPALSAEERSYNASIFRVQPTPDANRIRRDGVRWVPKTNARIDVPVVTLHTLGDLYVPFSMEQIYKRRADAAGTSRWLVQRAIRGISHCDFTNAEQIAAFEAMVKWEQQGIKPEGDNVLDPAVVAEPSYGCRFTDNTVSAETTPQGDSPTLARTRASLPQCPAS